MATAVIAVVLLRVEGALLVRSLACAGIVGILGFAANVALAPFAIASTAATSATTAASTPLATACVLRRTIAIPGFGNRRLLGGSRARGNCGCSCWRHI